MITTRKMLRMIFPISVALVVGAAGADPTEKVFTPSVQRREMAKVLATFTTKLSADEQNRLIDGEIVRGRANRTREKQDLMEEHAVTVAAATERLVRAARSRQIDQARLHLKETMIGILRAAGANSVFSREQSSEAGVAAFYKVQKWLVLSGAGSAFFAIATRNPILVEPVILPLLLANVVWFASSIPWTAGEFMIPGSTRLAHARGETPKMDEFWVNVGEYLRTNPSFENADIRDATTYRAFLENELGHISIDQACASALLLPPTEA